MPWPRIRWTLASLLCLSLLVGNVYLRFTPVRHKLVTSPRPGDTAEPVRFGGVWTHPDPQLALICTLRNDGAAPLDVVVEADGRKVKRATIRPGVTSRIDVSWARAGQAPGPYRVALTSSAKTWTLRYLEVANLHGFTRGAVEALILPAGQRFVRPPWWWLGALAAAAMLLRTPQPRRWPRVIRWTWVALAIPIAAVLVVVVLSPVVSPYQVALSPRTCAAAALVLAVPRAWALGCRLRTAWTPAAVRLAARLAAAPWLPGLAVGAAVVYFAFLVTHVGAYAGGADQSGYLSSARLLGLGRVTVPMRVVAGISPADLPPFAYVPLGFRPHGATEMSPTYPVGLPLAVLATARLTGWSIAPHATMVWHALLGVALMYWLGRMAGMSRGLSILASLMLATSPLYLFSSTTLMSDTPALVWTTAAVLLAWRSRDNHYLAALAGAAVALAVLVRPTNILVLGPVAACLGASRRRWSWLIAGGAPGAAILLGYNAAAYGNPLQTGYGDVRDAFALANVPASFRSYVTWLPVELTPLVVLAAGLPVLQRGRPRLVAIVALWAVSFCGLYAFYYHTHEAWWYLRFVLPAFPPLIAASLLVGRWLMDRWPSSRRPTGSRALAAVGFGVGLLVLAHNVVWTERLEAADAGRGERTYYEAATWARAHLPANSALLAVQTSGALFHYTDFPLLRWDVLSREQFEAVVAALEKRGQPLHAVLFPYEVEEQRALTDRVPGTWTLVGTVRQVTIWRFDGPLPAAAP
jgi:hypothetical protein